MRENGDREYVSAERREQQAKSRADKNERVLKASAYECCVCGVGGGKELTQTESNRTGDQNVG